MNLISSRCSCILGWLFVLSPSEVRRIDFSLELASRGPNVWLVIPVTHLTKHITFLQTPPLLTFGILNVSVLSINSVLWISLPSVTWTSTPSWIKFVCFCQYHTTCIFFFVYLSFLFLNIRVPVYQSSNYRSPPHHLWNLQSNGPHSASLNDKDNYRAKQHFLQKEEK